MIQEIITTNQVILLLTAGVVFSIIAPLFGQFMVYRGYSGISDGIGHISLVGIGAGLIVGQFQTILGFVVTTILAICMEFLRQNKRVRGETAIMIFITIALGFVAIIEEVFEPSEPIEDLLFGSLQSIKVDDVIILILLGLVSLLFVRQNYQKLLRITFNEELAKVQGIKTGLYNYLLILFTSFVVVAGINIVGGLLVGSLMVLPVASSSLLVGGFKKTHYISILLSMCTTIIGITIGLIIGFPLGASIALTSVVVFLCCLIVSYTSVPTPFHHSNS